MNVVHLNVSPRLSIVVDQLFPFHVLSKQRIFDCWKSFIKWSQSTNICYFIGNHLLIFFSFAKSSHLFEKLLSFFDFCDHYKSLELKFRREKSKSLFVYVHRIDRVHDMVVAVKVHVVLSLLDRFRRPSYELDDLFLDPYEPLIDSSLKN